MSPKNPGQTDVETHSRLVAARGWGGKRRAPVSCGCSLTRRWHPPRPPHLTLTRVTCACLGRSASPSHARRTTSAAPRHPGDTHLGHQAHVAHGGPLVGEAGEGALDLADDGVHVDRVLRASSGEVEGRNALAAGRGQRLFFPRLNLKSDRQRSVRTRERRTPSPPGQHEGPLRGRRCRGRLTPAGRGHAAVPVGDHTGTALQAPRPPRRTHDAATDPTLGGCSAPLSPRHTRQGPGDTGSRAPQTSEGSDVERPRRRPQAALPLEPGRLTFGEAQAGQPHSQAKGSTTRYCCGHASARHPAPHPRPRALGPTQHQTSPTQYVHRPQNTHSKFPASISTQPARWTFDLIL